jgi:hypothetical protein
VDALHQAIRVGGSVAVLGVAAHLRVVTHGEGYEAIGVRDRKRERRGVVRVEQRTPPLFCHEPELPRGHIEQLAEYLATQRTRHQVFVATALHPEAFVAGPLFIREARQELRDHG